LPARLWRCDESASHSWWPKEEPEPGIEIYRQLNGGCVVRVAKGCRRRAIEFDGAVMTFSDAGIYKFERKSITRFVR